MTNKRDFKVGDKITYKNEGKVYKGVVVEVESQHNILVRLNNFEGHNAHTSYHGPYKTKNHWWVRKNEIEFADDECIVIYRKGQEVIALDKTTGKKAVAKCSPEDKFDFNIGSKLAFERLLGIEQPEYTEVRREAKVGEYIKIVEPVSEYEGYEKGSILRVDELGYCGLVHSSNKLGKLVYVDTCEYVVLEGYEPPKEEKKEGFFKVLCIKDYTSFSGEKAFSKGKVYEYVNGACKREDGHISEHYKSFEQLLKQNPSYIDCLIELKEGDDPDEIMKQYYDFLEKFEEGKLYVFREELHNKHLGITGGWCKRVDGKIVNFTNKHIGEIEGLKIVPQWCEEIGYKK